MPRNIVAVSSSEQDVPKNPSPAQQSNDTQTQLQPVATQKPYYATWHSPFAGVMSGAIGGIICYPFEGAKKRAQSGQLQPWQMSGIRPHTFVRELYRGASAFVVSLAPTSMTQVTADEHVKKILPVKPELWQIYAAAGVSGAFGALFSAPVEHVILTQQKQKIGPLAALKYLHNRSPFYAWTALPPLAIREAVFGSIMLLATGKDVSFEMSLQIGLIGAGISHPFDTTATRMQRSEKRINMLQAAKEIYSEKGLRGFYAGYLFRSFLFTGCMFTIGNARRYIQDGLGDGMHYRLFKPTPKAITQAPNVQPSDAPRPK